MEKILLINKKSVGTKIVNHIIKANPDYKVCEIKTNTASYNESNLVSLKPKDHFRMKQNRIAVLSRNATWNVDPNGRSTDFLPSLMLSQGCKFGCSYCYCERHYKNDYPKVYDDVYEFVDFVSKTMNNIDYNRTLFKSINKKDLERYRDDKHPPYVTFDIGCDSDVSVDNLLSKHDSYPGHIVDIINKVSDIPEAMISFATKSANIDQFISGIKNPNMTRIRLSMMPEHHRKVLEMNTSKIEDRIIAINKLVDAGFEVHINLSPIVVTDKFAAEYADLLSFINENLSEKAKKQMAYEIIFLTHSENQFEHVKGYAPKAHNMMINGPLSLVPKWNKPNVLSYSRSDKNMLKQIMNGLIDEFTPYARIRYMF